MNSLINLINGWQKTCHIFISNLHITLGNTDRNFLTIIPMNQLQLPVSGELFEKWSQCVKFSYFHKFSPKI